MFTIDPVRLEKLREFIATKGLTKGSHKIGPDGEPEDMCINEAYAFLNGQKLTDNATCVCTSIRTVTMAANDRWGGGPRAGAKRAQLFEETHPRSTGRCASRRR